MDNKKPKCKLVGEDGNIYNLIGIASRALKKAGMEKQAAEMTQKVYKSQSYDEALTIILDYVDEGSEYDEM